MKRYVIDRKLPPIGESSHKDLQETAVNSNAALTEIGQGIQWWRATSSTTRTYCVYLATSEDVIRIASGRK